MNLNRLRAFVVSMTRVADAASSEPEMMAAARPLLADLVAQDDWLPEAAALPDPERYRQYLLHCDPAERFCLVSFVWGPGQKTPIHDHLVWGLIGMLRGAEVSIPYTRTTAGALIQDGEPEVLKPGDIGAVSPWGGDIHQVANLLDDQPSISIHLYGGNIGAVRRHTFGTDGAEKTFISGYSCETVPNLWDRSRELA
ncbi:MAG TPA: cysteine dioxygenase [Rhodopila sp.]|uniref:cysteine dioxygenase family protein n=1 Tax=Rhodopila sp. TaxID=2480087 RepID=UPI002CD49CE2|nr:cysteine dioxygenase [Rhodopila sp.]HVY17121.1 cysteine dioxygenase [Rhodopila sp.]